MKRSIAMILAATVTMSAFAGGGTDREGSAGTAAKPKLHILTPFDANIIGQEYVDNLYKAAEILGYDCQIENIDGETYKTRIKVALTGKQLPDVFFTWGDSYTEPFLQAKALLPLNDALAASGNTYSPSYIKPYADGNIYTAPYTPNDHFVVYYNKEIFARAEVGEPKTWEEFLAVIDAIKAKVPDVFPMCIAGKEKWQGDLLYNQMVLREDPEAFARAIAGKGSFTDKPFLDAAEKLAQLIAKEPFQRGYMQMTQPEIHELFWAGKVGMYAIGTWVFAPSIEKLGDKLGYFPFPQLKSDPDYKTKTTCMFGALPNGLVVSAATKSPKEAAAYALLYSKLINDDIVRKGRVPFMQTSVQPEKPRHPAYEKYVQDAAGITYLQPWWYGVIDPSIGEAMRDVNQEFFLKLMTPKDFTNRLNSTLSRAVKK